ncbi:Protein of unknown function, partial [Cotesia congregata]
MTKSRKELSTLMDKDKPRISFTPKINHSFNNCGKNSVISGLKKLWRALDDERIDSREFIDKSMVVMHEFLDDFFIDKDRIKPKDFTVIYKNDEAIDIEFETKCQKCPLNLIETINHPCNHADSCLPCSQISFAECTMCEKEVERKEKIFLPRDET